MKTNRLGAVYFARLLRAGELTALWVPDESHESMRDLVRARAAALEALRVHRQQVSAFMLKHGRTYPRKKGWTKAEALPEKQMMLGVEDVQQVAACTEASQDETAPEGRAERARKRRKNRGALPAHLPRIEVVVDLDAKTCPYCKSDLHQIGEDNSERLDMVPAQFRVVVTRRPKCACRACEDGILRAEAPARLIEGGQPTEATVAQVLASKYADHRKAKLKPFRL